MSFNRELELKRGVVAMELTLEGKKVPKKKIKEATTVEELEKIYEEA